MSLFMILTPAEYRTGLARPCIISVYLYNCAYAVCGQVQVRLVCYCYAAISAIKQSCSVWRTSFTGGKSYITCCTIVVFPGYVVSVTTKIPMSYKAIGQLRLCSM